MMALKEAYRVTKKEGILFTAYCNMDASILGYGFIKDKIKDLIKDGLIETNNFTTKSSPVELFQLYRKEMIDELIFQLNVERLHYIATDLFTNHMRQTVENMDDETFEIYLKYHLTICERADMVGMTHHMLDIVKKLK